MKNIAWDQKAFSTVFTLAASNPPAHLGAMVGGGASGATSQLTNRCIQSKEAIYEKNNY
jgi:hypothetical protein